MNQEHHNQTSRNQRRRRQNHQQQHYNNNNYYQNNAPNNLNNDYSHQPYQYYNSQNYQHQQVYQPPHQTTNKSVEEESKNDTIISKFDTSKLLQEKANELKTKMDLKHILYYHTDPTNNLLQFNNEIKPLCAKSANIESLIDINLNQIPIHYPNNIIHSLYQQKPAKRYWNTTRIDPFCHEIKKIENEIKSNDDIQIQTRKRFITYRHNLRAISNVVLFKLTKMRIFDKCGINIGVHRNGNDIFLENITEFDEKANESFFAINCTYGYLLEHTLESLANNNGEIEAMNYKKKCLDRDEIRALNQLQIGDIEILVAAEMDAIMNNKRIELKSCKMKSFKWRKPSKVSEIEDFKLLKYWTQCIFGGVDCVVIAFHEKGIIKKTRILTTQEIEKMFPVITSKCIKMVYEILKWIQNIVIKLPEKNLFKLSFDTNNQNNDQFIFKHLAYEKKRKKIFEMLSNFKNEKNGRNDLLNHGLVINPQNKQIELKQIL